MAEPSDYDKLQDGRLDDLESLVTAEYQPPEGTEYSYPVSNQGITQEQFRTMMRAAGKGTFVASSEEGAQVAYRLHKHATDSETNQRNTLILRPPNASVSGKAESVSNGFFHILTEDMELPFPAVTVATTYHVCVTYDPRLFKTTPLKIEVYPGTPPTSNGRDHIVLFTVQREPDQLLSQATTTTKGAWVSSVVTTFEFDRLPEPWDVDYGTLGVVIKASGDSEIYTSRGVHGWIPLASKSMWEPGPWRSLPVFSGWSDTASGAREAMYRVTNLGVQLRGRLFKSSGGGTNLAQFPTNHVSVRSVFRHPVSIDAGLVGQIRISPPPASGRNIDVTPAGSAVWVQLDGIIIPESLLNIT